MAGSIAFGAVILESAALIFGLLAATTAIGGFLARAHATLTRREEPEIQIETAIGGLVGLVAGLVVVLADLVAE